MMIEQSLNAIALILVFAIFIGFFYGPWQGYWVDRGRQALFQVRDHLFDLCASGEWDFNSPEYKILRAQVEKIIRYSHRITALGVLFLVVRSSMLKTAQVTEVFETVKSIKDPELRLKVEKAIGIVPIVIINNLIGPRSLLFVILNIFSHVFSTVKKWFEPISKMAVLSVGIEADRHEAASWKKAQSAQTTQHYPSPLT